jgi:hypothetical protein
MPKLVDKKLRPRVRKHRDVARMVKRVGKERVVTREQLAGEVHSDRWRFEAVMKAAERSGPLTEKSSRIAGRVSPALVEEAKRRTGIDADSDLIAFALANVALEDNFAKAFREREARSTPT